ncbi:MAG: histidine kinase [Planifilum fulgidum]
MGREIAGFLIRIGAQVFLWIGLWTSEAENAESRPWLLAACALYFSFYFLTPLFSRGRWLLIGSALAAASAQRWFTSGESVIPFLLYYILLLECLFAADDRDKTPAASGVALASLLPYAGKVQALPLTFHLFLLCLLAFAGIKGSEWRRTAEERREMYVGLAGEYRRLKRRAYEGEQSARIEERNRIARDMHDSVGHHLTALLIQIEVLRQQSGRDENRLGMIKALAKKSLEEIRTAVRALHEKEIQGLSSVIHLIRRLETDSQIRVNFTAKQGALSVPLSADKCVAIYRGIQEGLTNAMRHSFAREVDVSLDLPGGKSIRFEVSNRIREAKPYREGFGLKALRERVEQVGGRVEIVPSRERFTVRGIIPLDEKEDIHAQRIAGGRSALGAPGIEDDH